ncbi:MAG: small nuclear ribonucleoprotein Sm D3 [Alyxoria varia]|nr:MAG: small nuclear ribonucleoprotein Sm D3 [Alyxoria varia]
MTSTIGIPIKLLNEAQGHVVTLEITSGQVYRGKLLEAEDNMNVQLKDITVTARDGRVSHLDQVYIRGSHVRFFIVPDMLRYEPPPPQLAAPLILDLTGSAPDPRPIPDRPASSGDCRTFTNATPAREDSPHELQQNDGTGTSTGPATTTAGLSHTLSLTTRYYSAEIPVWIDETSSPTEWKADFLSPEATEVVKAVGAWVIVFRKGAQLAGGSGQNESRHEDGGGVNLQEKEQAKQLMQAVKEIIENAHDGEEEVWDGTCLAVGMPGSSWKVHGLQNEVITDKTSMVEPNTLLKTLDIQGEEDNKARAHEEWEDSCFDLGFEYVDGSMGRDSGTNEFGERQGTARILEALEANEWEAPLGPGDENDLDDLIEMGEFATSVDQDIPTKEGQSKKGNDTRAGDEGFNIEASQMGGEFASLKSAVRGVNVGQEEDAIDKEAMEVEELEKMMLKMTAVRGMFEDSLVFMHASQDSALEENADIKSRYERPYARAAAQTTCCKDRQRHYARPLKPLLTHICGPYLGLLMRTLFVFTVPASVPPKSALRTNEDRLELTQFAIGGLGGLSVLLTQNEDVMVTA